MKKKIVFPVVLSLFLVLCFVACDTGVDINLDPLVPRAEFVAETEAGTVSIRIFEENPVRSAVTGDFFVILLNGNVISSGRVEVSGGSWTFRQADGELFSGNFVGGTLSVQSIPYAGGPISGFTAEQRDTPVVGPPGHGNINMVGFWDCDGTIEPALGLVGEVRETFEFRADMTFLLRSYFNGVLESVYRPSPFTVSGNHVTLAFTVGMDGEPGAPGPDAEEWFFERIASNANVETVHVTVVNNSFTLWNVVFTRRN